MTVRAVVFDVGETLVDETRAWGLWADWLGVPGLTFFAALGAVIARGGHHREVFELFRSGIDLRFVRRGPWGWLGEDGVVPPEAAAVVGSLTEIPEALRALG